MLHYKQSQDSNLTFAIVVLIGAAVWTHRERLVHIAYVSFGVIALLLLLSVSWRIIAARYHARHHAVDGMSGLEFERYVAGLLKSDGFNKISLTEQYDYGVDIIAEKEGVRWGIQAKRYSGIVGADAVRQVVTGLRIYGCSRSMVITNSTFSEFAGKLAEGNDCILVDRSGLRRLERAGSYANRGAIL